MGCNSWRPAGIRVEGLLFVSFFVVCDGKEVTAAYFFYFKKNPTRVGRSNGASGVQRVFCWEAPEHEPLLLLCFSTLITEP